MSRARSSTRGTRQHYLPASYLAQFSADVSRPRRLRRVWVSRLGVADPYPRTVETLARERGLYDVTAYPPSDALGVAGTADVAWGYEQRLPEVLEGLQAGRPLDGRAWLTVAVPFVAGLFVRGPDFQQEFWERIPLDLDELMMDRAVNATAARLMDFQLLLAVLMAARWVVLHFPAGVELVTNDRGFALTSTSVGAERAYVVPIGRRAALVVVPRICGQPLRWTGGRWEAELEHRDVAAAEAPALNRATGAFARREVYGATRESVAEASPQLGEAQYPGAGLFEPLDPPSHLYDYFRVLSVIGAGPDDAQARADTLDWSTINEADWTAPVVVEVLFPDRASGGVRVEGDQVIVDLAHGVAQREARRNAGDFRMGAMALIDLSQLRRLGARGPG
jgi:hypothetical protein